MATSQHRIYVRQPLRSVADAAIGRWWTEQDLRAYRLGRSRYERLQLIVDNDAWAILRVEQDQRDETTALEMAKRAWDARLRAELRLLRRSDEPLPETDGGPRDVPPPPPDRRPPVSDDDSFDATGNPTLPGVVVIRTPDREPLDEAAIQAWADFYAAFPPQV